MTYTVTLIPGDGIGPELTEATRRVLEIARIAGAGGMNASGRYYLLLPREAAARMGTAAPAD